MIGPTSKGGNPSPFGQILPKGVNVPSSNVHNPTETIKGGYGGLKQQPGPAGKTMQDMFPKGGDPSGKGAGYQKVNDPYGKGQDEYGSKGDQQGKAPGQHLSNSAQTQLLGYGMSPQGVRQLASGMMPTSPGDQEVVFHVLGNSLG